MGNPGDGSQATHSFEGWRKRSADGGCVLLRFKFAGFNTSEAADVEQVKADKELTETNVGTYRGASLSRHKLWNTVSREQSTRLIYRINWSLRPGLVSQNMHDWGDETPS